jgi:RluA family pseudouridine synthase
VLKDEDTSQHSDLLTNIQNAVLYEDDLMLIVNKPPSVLSELNLKVKAPNIISLLQKQRKKTQVLFPCHRLDKETSGVLVLAKTQAQTTFIMDQFREQTIQKSYLALSYGVAKKKDWDVTCYLSKIDSKTGLVQKVHAGGYHSVTSFHIEQIFAKQQLSLISCVPKTGRSHQIRVHLMLSQHPIVGDKKYSGDRKPPRGTFPIHHMLHAKSIQLVLAPGEAPVQFKADLYPDFENMLKALS